MGARMIFFPGWAMRGLKDQSSQRGPGREPRWGSRGDGSEAGNIFSKQCINISSTETTFAAQKQFTTFPGESATTSRMALLVCPRELKSDMGYIEPPILENY